MHLAILVTNTDLSDFAHRHPLDGEKFTAMIQSVRPDWQCCVFEVHQGDFPDSLDNFDGAIITGSPASVHDRDPWVTKLLDTIRTADVPLYGACYGHQAIALALGGTVENNPHGWSFGLVRCDIMDAPSWMSKLGKSHYQFAAHTEQVTKLPKNARAITCAQGVENNGFIIGNHIYTSQNHPEMTPDFFAALLAEYEDKLPPETVQKAYISMEKKDSNKAYAETIAAFFEQAIS